MGKIPRMIGIVFCGVMLLVPQSVCFIGAPPNIMKAADVVRLCFPLWFVLLVQISIDEGRARERESNERRGTRG